MLVERMVSPEDRARVPPVNDAAARRHGARHRVRARTHRRQPLHRHAERGLRRRAGEAWLGGAGVKIAETVARPALVIPLWKGKAGVEPLDDRNAWREAWRALDTPAAPCR